MFPRIKNEMPSSPDLAPHIPPPLNLQPYILPPLSNLIDSPPLRPHPPPGHPRPHNPHPLLHNLVLGRRRPYPLRHRLLRRRSSYKHAPLEPHAQREPLPHRVRTKSQHSLGELECPHRSMVETIRLSPPCPKRRETRLC